jgi:hypothetical protein
MTDERHDEETGEIIEGDALEVELAADGGLVPYGATTAGDIINMIEDGQLSADIVQAVGELVATMTDMAAATGNKQKGSLAIKIDFATEGGPFTAKASFKTTAPKEVRRPTLLFTDEHNRLTRTQPKQRQFFGVRQVGGSGPVRRI